MTPSDFLRNLPRKLGRITSGRKLIGEIDGLRFLAITPVLIQHLSERFERNTSIVFARPPEDTWSGFFASRGFLGVYIFFVISGFILALPFASHHLKGTRKIVLKDYYWRRLTRLEPPFLFWMIILFVVFLVVNSAGIIAYLPHFLASITYTHTLIYNQWSPFNPPTWTLEIEIQFYILAPFLAHLFFSIKHAMKRRLLLIGGLAGFMLLQQALGFYANPFSFTVLGHLHYFLLGFLLVDIYLTDWTVIRHARIFDLLAVASGFGLIFSWSWEYGLVSRFLVVLCLFMLFYSVFRGVWVNRFVTNPWITGIGGMCYTIYLIHLPLAELLVQFTKDIDVSRYFSVNLLFQLIIYFPFVLIVSVIGFLLIEKPCMDKDWPKQLKSKLLSAFGKKVRI